MNRLEQRLQRLEQQQTATGGCVYVDTRALTPTEAKQAINQAHKTAATVMVIQQAGEHMGIFHNGYPVIIVRREYWGMLE